MKVERLMTSPPRCCGPQDSLVTAAEIMWASDCGCVPVVDEERRVVGMITDRDICMAAYHSGESLRTQTVGSAMSASTAVCTPQSSVHETAELMSRRQLRRIPVVNPDGSIVGIISINDLALAAAQGEGAIGDMLDADEVAATLAAISRHRPSPHTAEPH